MTNQEIKNAADKFISENPLVPHIDHWSFRRGAEMVNQKQPYSAEDMIAWKNWYIPWGIQHIKKNPNITDNELIKLWEESKNG